MSDDFQLQWRVSAMDCYPNLSGEKDYVFNTHWDCLTYYSGVSGGPFYGRTYSTTMVATGAPIVSGSYIPYQDLPETTVLGWIWEVMGQAQKEQYEQYSTNQIYNQLNPPVVQPPLPWKPDVFPILPPYIINSPVDLTMWSGGMGALSVNAGGQPLNFTWRQNGVDISGSNSANYSFSNVQPDQAGTYDVIVFNSLGSVTSSGCNVVVNMPTAPEITLQPVNVSGNYQSFVALNVLATGYPSPSYQWRKDNVDISGANESRIFFNMSESTTGLYDAVVSNIAGSVTSNTAEVSLTGPVPTGIQAP